MYVIEYILVIVLTQTAVNGIPQSITYEKQPVLFLPKTPGGQAREVSLPRPVSLTCAALAPLRLGYDASGYLHTVEQGSWKEELVVERETERERLDKLDPHVKPAKKTGKIAGRLRADKQFRYDYGKKGITLTDKTGRRAVFRVDPGRSIQEITDFTGKKQTTYYYARYDVAYMGQVRQIVDERDRVVMSCRYDRTTGAVARRRNLLDNDQLYEYDGMGNVVRVLRQASNSETPEPVRSIGYDTAGFPVSLSVLNEKGKAVVTTKVSYTRDRQPATIDNGENRTSYTYNAFGYPVTVKNALGQGIRKKYDAYNRLVEEKGVNGLVTRYLYDGSGNVCRVEKKDGEAVLNSADVERDENGRFLSIGNEEGAASAVERDANASEIGYSYDPLGRLASVNDENGRPIFFEWGTGALRRAKRRKVKEWNAPTTATGDSSCRRGSKRTR